MSEPKETDIKNKNYGNKLGYDIFAWLMKNTGVVPAYCLLALIIPYYMLFRPGVYRSAKPYLQHRFPQDSGIKRYFRSFKYTYIFGQFLIDQAYFGFVGENKFKFIFERKEEIVQLTQDQPVIFLMSHLGYWEISIAASECLKKQVSILVDQSVDKNKRQSFYDRRKDDFGFKFISAVDDYGGMIEAVNALLRKEIVGVTGDRAEKWRCASTIFMGDNAKFPIIAQQLALATNAPIIALFTYGKPKMEIHIEWVDVSSSALNDATLNKEQKIEKMLSLYAGALEKHLERYPYLWFNFFDFWKV